MASKLYVGGLSYSTTSEGLREFFAQSGNVLSATVITDRFSGQSRGFGFVEMASGLLLVNGVGSVIGPIVAARLGIPTVDVGSPMWAMHSARESAGTLDHTYMIRVLTRFFLDTSR